MECPITWVTRHQFVLSRVYFKDTAVQPCSTPALRQAIKQYVMHLGATELWSSACAKCQLIVTMVDGNKHNCEVTFHPDRFSHSTCFHNPGGKDGRCHHRAWHLPPVACLQMLACRASTVTLVGTQSVIMGHAHRETWRLHMLNS